MRKRFTSALVIGAMLSALLAVEVVPAAGSVSQTTGTRHEAPQPGRGEPRTDLGKRAETISKRFGLARRMWDKQKKTCIRVSLRGRLLARYDTHPIRSGYYVRVDKPRLTNLITVVRTMNTCNTRAPYPLANRPYRALGHDVFFWSKACTTGFSVGFDVPVGISIAPTRSCSTALVKKFGTSDRARKRSMFGVSDPDGVFSWGASKERIAGQAGNARVCLHTDYVIGVKYKDKHLVDRIFRFPRVKFCVGERDR